MHGHQVMALHARMDVVMPTITRSVACILLLREWRIKVDESERMRGPACKRSIQLDTAFA